jgi:CheY-like chemotaxis protein
MRDPSTIIILMADDDPEDRMLTQDALDEARLDNELHFAYDGEDMLNYLHRRGRHENLKGTPLPGLILLDLNMPRKDGREALAEVKADPSLRHIPVVVLTTSNAETDVVRTYDLGVNSYITKPVTFDGLVNVMRTLANYWFKIVLLPPDSTGETDDDTR